MLASAQNKIEKPRYVAINTQDLFTIIIFMTWQNFEFGFTISFAIMLIQAILSLVY